MTGLTVDVTGAAAAWRAPLQTCPACQQRINLLVNDEPALLTNASLLRSYATDLARVSVLEGFEIGRQRRDAGQPLQVVVPEGAIKVDVHLEDSEREFVRNERGVITSIRPKKAAGGK